MNVNSTAITADHLILTRSGKLLADEVAGYLIG